MSTLILDIETLAPPLPDADRTAIGRAAAKRDQSFDDFAALCPPLCRIVAIGMLSTKTGIVRIDFDSTVFEPLASAEGIDLQPSAGEDRMLAHALPVIGGFSHLVTFNGRGFDLPALYHRALINGLAVPSVITASLNQKPWEYERHLDMMQALTFGGAMSKYSLEVFSIAYGLTNPKAGGDGGHVRELAERKDTGALAKYLSGDLRTTEALWRTWTTKSVGRRSEAA
jgi:hypothetical protein